MIWFSTNRKEWTTTCNLRFDGVLAKREITFLLLLPEGLSRELFRSQLATESTGLLGAKVERLVLFVLESDAKGILLGLVVDSETTCNSLADDTTARSRISARWQHWAQIIKTHILESLEAGPPETFATRSWASSFFNSSICLRSSSLLLDRNSCALIFNILTSGAYYQMLPQRKAATPCGHLRIRCGMRDAHHLILALAPYSLPLVYL